MIEIKNVVKDYVAGDMVVKALKGVNINFRDSEFVSILGPSGCGKTTLLNIIGGLDQYTDGDIIIDGVSTKDYKDKDWDAYRNHYIGFVFQSYNLIAHLSILENVELALSIAGMSRKEKRSKAIEALEKVGLKDQIKKKPNQLSGGQMQRVAIARAIVNNPKIILADEPTGALDSETSVQVMDILKEISKTCLVVMVTHNGDLAEKYSDRIINILDGELTHDSKPYKPKKKDKIIEVSDEKESDENIKLDGKKKTKKNKIHSAMSFVTAFSLSFKNLISKKWKTILVSFAGSIGIIGIALVLAVSNGLNRYISNMQSDTLSGYPVTIGTFAVDFNTFTKLRSEQEDKKSIDKNIELELYNMSKNIEKLGTFNFLNKEFMNHIDNYYALDQEKEENSRELTALKYSYKINMPIITEYNGAYISVNTASSSSALTGATSNGIFSEGINNKEYILENYEVLGGENAHYPQNANEVALVVSKNNTMSVETLMGYGFYFENNDISSIKFEDLIGKEYRILSNDVYYEYDSVNNKFSVIDLKNSINNQSYYNNAEETTSVKVSCVLRAKEDAKTEILSNGLMYLPELSELLKAQAKESQIYSKTMELTLADDLYIPYEVDIQELATVVGNDNAKLLFPPFSTGQQIKDKLSKAPYNLTLSDEDVKQLMLQAIGASDIPVSISIYTKSFDAKQNVINYITEWNNSTKTANNKITYSDATAFLTDTLGNLIDIISYVLIAFAGISLVVSSIMIGIITYTSVIERTKEIGVLRSIGARKKDISRVFNSETLIIGLVSGTIGVLISWILTFPISAIIKKIAGGTITSSMAILTWPNALILIAISTILTMISGLVPSRIAAKKDPVKALRTE